MGREKKTIKKEFSFGKIFFILIVLMMGMSVIFQSKKSAIEITWHEFEKNIFKRNAVEKIILTNNDEATLYIKKDKITDPYFKEAFKPNIFGKTNTDGPQYKFTISSAEVFEEKMNEIEKNISIEDRIPVIYKKSSGWAWEIAGWILPIIFIAGIWMLLGRKISGIDKENSSVFNFGKSKATLIEKEKSNISFSDVAGLDEAEEEVKEIIDFLKNPISFTKLGAKIPKGIILVGPPGTGKTLLAKAVAGEAKVPFFSISGSEFVEMFVGVGASRVRDLFIKAKEKAPCIIFIDEIDAIGKTRGKGAFLNAANDERESTLNQLLTEMDGFSTNSGVIVLAATNRADILDPALLRPGRFDRHIYLELPNAKERAEIFKVHLRPLITDQSIEPELLAAQTPGFSGADIANICNESALIAARKKKNTIDKLDFSDAIDRIVVGIERKSKIISPSEKKKIAIHEAGHLIISWILKQVDPIAKVSIIPRGKTLGAAWYLPEERVLKGETAFNEMLCATLGGRAAEEIIFKEVSSGALDDLEKATNQAYMMVEYYGFNKKIGNISYYDSSGRRDLSLQKPFSEDTGKIIDEEVRNIIEASYKKSLEILNTNKENLNKIADLLIKKETIFKEDIELVLGKRELTGT